MNLTAFYSERATWRNAGEEQMRYRRALKVLAKTAGIGKTVLDIGCRDCGLRDLLPASVEYQGIDIAPEFLAAGVIIRDVSIGLPFATGYFDTVFAIDVLEHTTNPARVLREIRRVLTPGGRAIVSIPNPYHVKEIVWNLLRMPDRQGHIFSWTRQAFTALADMTGLEVVATGGTYWLHTIPASGLLARSIIYALRVK